VCECRESTEIVSQGSTGARLPFAVDGGTFELDANTLPGMSFDWNCASSSC
jgi:hypothetical protein